VLLFSDAINFVRLRKSYVATVAIAVVPDFPYNERRHVGG